MREHNMKFIVLETFRYQRRQDMLVRTGKSKMKVSKHQLGKAFDAAPIINGRIPWSEADIWCDFAAQVRIIAEELGVPLIWGGDWKKLVDMDHFELP
jgi:peptidoglycan L-alanyl-D-glutamate endopeptidase CwlK